MTLKESERLQARIAGMSCEELMNWLEEQIRPHVTEAYSAGYEDGRHHEYDMEFDE